MRINETNSKGKTGNYKLSINRRKFVRSATTALAVAPFFNLYGCSLNCRNRHDSHLVRYSANILDLALGLSFGRVLF